MFHIPRSVSVVRKATCSVIEGLESRRLLSASLTSHGVLNVHGTPHSDVIAVSLNAQNSGVVDVTVNGNTKSFVAAKVRIIKVSPSAGNDSVAIDSSVTTPASIQGGAGHDTLVAGSGNDTLKAGPGGDSLVGGAGTDTLVGGRGNDTILCSAGADSVNGGVGKDSVQFAPSAGVALTDVPAAVQAGLTTLAQGAAIGSVQVFQDDHQTYYGTVVTISGQQTRIVVDASGTPVGNEPPHGHGNHLQGGQGPGEDGSDQNDGVFGKITGTSATSITVSASNPWGPAATTTFTVTPSTVITADGATVASAASLADGTLVCVQTSSTDATTATSIIAIDRRVSGTVTANDGTTISITDQSGASASYTLNSAVMVTLNGVASTVADITVGSHVELKISATDGTVVSIDSDPQEDSGGGSGGPVDTSHVGGSVFATTATTITLENEAGVQTTYTVPSTAAVTLDGAASTLPAIVAGDRAQLTLATDGTVTGVEASSHPDGGGDNGGGDHQPLGAFGSIVGTPGTTITIQSGDSATPTTYTLGSAVTVTLDGATSSVSALAAGDSALLTLSADGTTVTGIQASDHAHNDGGDGGDNGNPGQPSDVEGSLVSTTASTITLQPESGLAATFTLAAGATVTLDGTASSLSTLTAGDPVHLQLSADGTMTTNVVAQSAEITTHDPIPAASGVVVSTNPTSNTITITVDADNGTQATYTITAGTPVNLDGAASTLSALTAGEPVEITLGADGTTVLGIYAASQPNSG